MTIDIGAIVVGLGAQLHIGHIRQAQQVTVRGGAHHDILELTHVVEQTVVFDVDFVDGALKTTDRSHEVLLVDGGRNFIRGDVVHTHHVGFEPDTHTIDVTEQLGTTHARDTADSGYDIDVQVVRDELLVKSVVGALQAENLQDGVHALGDGHTLGGHHTGQQTQSAVHTVLHIRGGLVGIGTLLEIDVDFRTPVGTGGGGHVQHVFHTVHLLLNRHDDRLLHRVGVSTAVVGRDNHHGRGDIGVLLDRQREDAEQTDEKDDHTDGERRHPVLHKEFGFLDVLFHRYLIFMPLESLRAPLVTTSSPTFRPSSM